MDPRKDPTRRCLRVCDSPEPDRRAWESCLQQGDPWIPVDWSNWAPLTRKQCQRLWQVADLAHHQGHSGSRPLSGRPH